MRYRTYAVAVVTAAVFISGLSFASASPEPGTKDNGMSVEEEAYLTLYEQAQEQFGSATVGANVVDDGMGQWDAYNVPDSIVDRKAATLDAMLHPPPPTLTAESQAPAPVGDETVEPTTSTPATGSYSIPSYIVECESGGDYSAVNPSSGAGGAYQILPSTWSAYGGSSAGPAAASPAEQDQIAAEIYADSGGAAWVC